jgi:hypothetical protein
MAWMNYVIIVAAFTLACLTVPREVVAGEAVKQSVEGAETVLIRAQGTASIYGGNAERARLAALRSAYAEAVRVGSGRKIGGLLFAEDLKQVSDIMMNRSRGAVRTYRIREEGLKDNNPGQYIVTIEAEVLKEASDNAADSEGIRQFVELLGNPKVLIIVPAVLHASTGSNAGGAALPEEQKTLMQSAEAAVAQVFTTYGYQVVTSDDLLAQGYVNPDMLLKQMESTAESVSDVLKIARAVGADMVLLGAIRTSRSLITPAGVPMVMISAETSAKAVSPVTGKTIQAFHYNDRSSAPDELRAYSDCLDKAAHNLAHALALKIPGMLAAATRETRLTIHGADMRTADKIRSLLAGSSGIAEVRFSRLPTAADQSVELLLVSGFVMVSPDEILDIVRNNFGTGVALLKAEKYEMGLQFSGK